MQKSRVSSCFLWLVFSFSSPVIALTPESGWWWNPAESGRGFNIETQDRTVFIATFIYDELGNPVWYSGSGELDEQGIVTVPALRFEGGQCPGCPFQAPQVTGDEGPLTLHFTSEMTAVAQWAGADIPLERFNFKLGDDFQKLLGEWMMVIGNPDSSSYGGDRLILGGMTAHEGEPLVQGHRTGAPHHPLIALPLGEDEASGIKVFIILLASSPNAVRSFLFRPAGLNAIEGITAVSEGSGVPEEVIDAEQVLEDLAASGVHFIGKRHHGATEVGAVLQQVTASSRAAAGKELGSESPVEAGSWLAEAGIGLQGQGERLAELIERLK